MHVIRFVSGRRDQRHDRTRANLSLAGMMLIGCFAISLGCQRLGPGLDESAAADAHNGVPFAWKSASAGLRAAPLPPRFKVPQAKRFTALAVRDTGLDYALNWVPPEAYKFEIYNSLPGGGICIGDYDGDDLPDVFLTQPNVGSRLYRNRGQMRFEDTTDAVGIGANPYAQGAVMVDLDGDSDLDLFVCNDEHPNRLYINDGQGYFQESAAKFGLDFSGASVQMSFADYDRDGDLDAYLVTNRVDPAQPIPQPTQGPDGSFSVPDEHREFIDVIVAADGRPRVVKAGQYDHLYRNNGDGSFTDVSAEAGIQGAHWGLSSIWWDYNQDGWADLYVSNDFYSPDQLYRNNQDGTFTDVAAHALPHTPWYSMGTDVADINNDGRFDLMGSDMSGTNHYKQKVSMGDMSTTSWFLTHPTPRQYMRNALYLNTGTERFAEIAQLSGVANTDWTWSLKFADLDEDGWTDLYVTNGMNRDWTNSDLRNLTNGMTSEVEKMKVWLDSPPRQDANLAYRNDGNLRFEAVGVDWGLATAKVSYGAALSDLDRDGDLDLIVNNAEQAPDLYRNNTADGHRVLIRLDAGAHNRFGIGTTVSITTSEGLQWRQLTSSQGYMAANEPIIHFGLGTCDRMDRLEVTWPDGSQQSYSDLLADQYYHISKRGDLEQSVQPDEALPYFQKLPVLTEIRHQETPFNDFARQPLLPNQLSQLGPGMAWNDVDQDGDSDMFLGGASGQSGQLLINQGDFNFVASDEACWRIDAAAEDMAPLFFDADGDGDQDLYVVSGGVECAAGDEVLQDRLYLNDGRGRFSGAPSEMLPEIRDSGSVAVTCDFDRDGDLDLFVGGRVVPGEYPISPRSYLLVNNNGRFADATDQLAPELRQPGMVTSAVWSDSDGDGWTDLLITLEWGSVRRFSNDQGRLRDATSGSGLDGQTGWYNSILAHDLDQDGDMDYAVGNHGWNSKYHASSTRPTLLYYGDFENSGRKHLVEAEFEDEVLFPVRGRSCSTNAMPFLGQRFTKFHDFAVASLEDIYTPSRLENAQRFAASSLDSGVWLNQGNHTFRFLPFPVLAQVAPVFGITACDANQDAVVDLLIAQNFYGPQAETGRADGGLGLLMLGQGDGTFTTVIAEQSGIVVPDDATALCRADLDGDHSYELIFATNDGPLHVFGVTLDAAARPNQRTVRLIGERMNRQAIGARLSVGYRSGGAFEVEISAGGGYLSQSTADVALSPHRQPESLTVRWPSGRTVRYVPQLKERLIEIHADENSPEGAITKAD